MNNQKRRLNAKTIYVNVMNSPLVLPLLALVSAFILGALVIWITSGSFNTVLQAYGGMLYGAFFKTRGLSETLITTVPYVFLGLGVAVGFKTGLFNIGVEGQYYLGAIFGVAVGIATTSLPAVVHLPLIILAGAVGGALWAAIPGFLKALFGAHEVITTIMMNYVAFRFTEYMVNYPLRDPQSTAVQTSRIAPNAEVWLFSEIPARLLDPLNALAVALIVAYVVFLIARTIRRRREARQSAAPLVLSVGRSKPVRAPSFFQRHSSLISAAIAGAITLVGLPLLTRIWWPFTDPIDRLHVGVFLAVGAVFAVWWLLWKTTIGFELRTVGANPNAARYAGMSITRNIVLAMAISGALAGIGGIIDVAGVSICRCLPLFFSSGYGFDSIAISLLASNNPFGILGVAFLWGVMQNGSISMEFQSGVSKYITSLIQALLLLFVSAPAIVSMIFRIRARKPIEATTLTSGWGGKA